jgi:pyrrolysyl-tRNA synthetase-like protein
MSDNTKKKYYRKHVALFPLVDKIKLWPSRNGTLHGIRTITVRGDLAEITTHCGQTFRANNSKSSRAARWLRNKWMTRTCKSCKIPDWKLEKYSTTFFSEHYGKELKIQD